MTHFFIQAVVYLFLNVDISALQVVQLCKFAGKLTLKLGRLLYRGPATPAAVCHFCSRKSTSPRM